MKSQFQFDLSFLNPTSERKKVAVDLRATVRTNPRLEIAGYQLHSACNGKWRPEAN